MARASSVSQPAPAGKRAVEDPAWLLLLHQLPAHPTSLRVRTWRRLQQVGAIPVKHAVHALPDSPHAREDFEWLRAEITGAGGDATIFVARTVDGWAHDALVEQFQRARAEAYRELGKELDAARQRMTKRSRRERPAAAAAAVAQFRQRLAAIERMDFFGSAGRDAVRTQLEKYEQLVQGARPELEGGSHASRRYAGRLWVTRPRPGVDRMASAWLIRRFIDGAARFDFAREAPRPGGDAVPFDMFGVEFSHRGDRCTFEVLCAEFQLVEPALSRIAAVVHDLDLGDEKFAASETAAIGAVIEGLRLAHADDQTLLSSGISLFEALYLRFAQTSSPPDPTALPRRPRPRRPVVRRSKR